MVISGPRLVFVLATVLPICGHTQTPEPPSATTAAALDRIQAFRDAQRLCKLGVLQNKHFATTLLSATSASISNVCECASALAVSSMADQEVHSFRKKDARMIHIMFDGIKRNLEFCASRSGS